METLSLWGMGDVTQNFSQKPHCPNLTTMLMRDTLVRDFPTEIFVLPRTIIVLDLSPNEGITNLPSTIENVINLEHMNLSNTGITKMLEELKNLKKLRHLLLDGIKRLELPREVISSLSSLQGFSMIASFGDGVTNENMLLDEFEGLDYLQDVGISIKSRPSLQKILTSSKLQMRIYRLMVWCQSDASSLHDLFSSLVNMKHLELLLCSHYDRESEDTGSEDSKAANIPWVSFWGNKCTINLRQLVRLRCSTIFNLNWLTHAPNLKVLSLEECNSLEEVITEDFGNVDSERVKSNLFSSLIHLELLYLSNLRGICRMPLQFPCLKDIDIQDCPNLKKLPFNSQSELKNLKAFIGSHDLFD